MADDVHNDPFHDVINLLAAPLAGGIRSYEQFRTGIDELFRTIENLNRTMEQLNETAERVNRLMSDVEDPIRAIVPQLARAVDTVSSPAFAAVPQRLGEIVEVLSDASRRLGPLTQFAETAGGLFGLPSRRQAADPSTVSTPTATTPGTKKAPAKKKARARKATATKASPRSRS